LKFGFFAHYFVGKCPGRPKARVPVVEPAGARPARRFCPRLGLSAAETELVDPAAAPARALRRAVFARHCQTRLRGSFDHREGFDLPYGCELLAQGDIFKVQAIRFASAFALQFHPEDRP
jgi:hypothetical protein